jgi:DNA mismatch endonuclease (patch repair protein)
MPLTRSENMSRIRARDTEPEVALRKALWARGIRYRANYRTPGGKADLAIPGRKFAVFVDGCFWHGCPEHFVRPRSSKAFWDNKLRENVDRDRRQTRKLLEQGWTCVRVWEHELRESLDAVVSLVLRELGCGGAGHWPDWRVVKVEFLDTAGEFESRSLEELVGPGRRAEQGPRVTLKEGRVVRQSVSSGY